MISGRPIEGSSGSLAPDMQTLLWLRDTVGLPAVEDLPLDRARIELERQSRLVAGAPRIGETRDITIATAAGELQGRIYVPSALASVDARPTLVFFHGGAMIYGSLDSHDAAVRHLAEHSGVQVISVAYRLAPETPFPGPVEDCIDALEWVVAHATQVDVDPAMLAVGGDSAGGYFAATTSIKAAERGIPLRLQLLIYPVAGFTIDTPSHHEFADGFYLTRKFLSGGYSKYLPHPENLTDPLVELVARDSFPEGLAPAYVVTAGFDPLRDEGRQYAELLASHGVTVEELRCEDMIHGFFNMLVCPAAAEYAREIAMALGRELRP